MPNFKEFPNLELLDLRECVKLVKLDPSIGLLRKIAYLNLEGCVSLISIPNTIFGINSLKYINMSRCSKLFNNISAHMNTIKRALHSHYSPDIDLYTLFKFYWFYGLSTIDISFCGLRQVPDAIGCLHQIQSLNLEGNNFVSLPSLKEFSKLVYLNLNHCKFLESLPQLPCPPAINWDLCTDIRHSVIGLHIFNCPKLCEREYRNAFSWMKQFIQANPQFPGVIDIVIPGSEIPSWFNNQSEGHRILIDYSPIKHDINNDIIGFLCCSVFSVGPGTPSIFQKKTKLGIELDLIGFHFDGINNLKHWLPDHRIDIIVYYPKEDLIKVETNHIWLTYFPRKLSWYVPDFHGTMDVKFEVLEDDVTWNEVKNCRYGWLHKQDLQEFDLTTMHLGNSSALKRKFLAIEDEAQQQPKLHSFI